MSAAHAEVIAAAQQWAAAIVSNDAARIAAFMADEWVIVSESGVSPRAEFLSAVSSGKLTHSAMDLVSDPRVQIYGDMAIFTGRVTNTAHYEGNRYDANEWTTDVFVRHGDRWLCVLSHITAATPADDPFGGRLPTSHERLTGVPWDASYHDGPAPWDVGRPQPAIVRLAAEGGFAGAVLDVGCGTGENALHVASLGLPVLGVDVAATALAIARAKADDRGIDVEFAAADAFQLERLGRTFETVLDCGLFHTFDGDERPRYVASLASVTEHEGTLYVLCFSDDGPETGPHPIRREELSAAFNPGTGWNVSAIEPDRIQTRYHDDGAPAWLATITRI